MTKEFINYIKELIEQKDSVLLQESISKLHPADIAELCIELSVEEARFLYRQLDNERAADALTEMDEDLRNELLEELPSEAIAKRFVNYMDTDDAVVALLLFAKQKKFQKRNFFGREQVQTPLGVCTCKTKRNAFRSYDVLPL